MKLFHDTATYVPTDDEYAPLPIGQYKAMITKVEEKQGKTSGVPYASLTIEIIEGPYKGRKMWDILSIHSANEKAVAIAKKKLNQIAMAIGILVISGEDDFKYKQIGIDIDLDKTDATRNQIKRYIPYKDVVDPVVSHKEAVKNSYNSAPIDDDVPF